MNTSSQIIQTKVDIKQVYVGGEHLHGNSVLIHVGFHKTASTWLQKKVFTKQCGFIQPLEMDEISNLIVCPSFAEYSPVKVKKDLLSALKASGDSEGLIPVISHERLSEDPWTGGRDSQLIANRLANTFPDAKVLIVVRDQTSMLASLYKTYIALGGKATLNNFFFPPKNEQNNWFSPDMYKYDIFVQYYYDLFGAGNVKVMDFAELKENKKEFVEEIVLFSGAAGGMGEDDKAVNTGLSDFSVKILRLTNVFFGVFEAYPLSVSRSGAWKFVRSRVYNLDFFIRRVYTQQVIRGYVAEKFKGYYDESNEVLSEMVGKPFFLRKKR